MKKFNKFLDEAGRCWPGYKPVPGKKPFSLGSCRKEEVEQIDEISKETAGKYLTAPQGKGANKYKVSSDKSVYPNIETMSKHSTNVRRALKRSEGSSLYKKPDYYKEEVEELDEAKKMEYDQKKVNHLKYIVGILEKEKKEFSRLKGSKEVMDIIDKSINLFAKEYTKHLNALSAGRGQDTNFSVHEEVEKLDEKIISVRNATGHIMKVASQFKDIYKKHGYKPVPGTRLESAEQLDEYESKGGVYKHKGSYGTSDGDYFPPKKMGRPNLSDPDPQSSHAGAMTSGRKSGEDVRGYHVSSKVMKGAYSAMRREEYEEDDGPLTEDQLEQIEEVAAWQRKEGKSEAGGLNRKGIESYRRENPGSKLSMAVTTKPSKLKPGSKAANRRKSFCARMGGLKRRLTSSKTANDPNSRVNKALRKWNC